MGTEANVLLDDAVAKLSLQGETPANAGEDS